MARGQYTSIGQHHGGHHGGGGGWGGGWGGRGWGSGWGGRGFGYGLGYGGLGYGLGYPYGYGLGYPYSLGYPYGPGYASYSYARPYLDIADNGIVYDTGGYYLTTPNFYGATFVGSPYASAPVAPHWRSNRFAQGRRKRRIHHILGAY